MAAQPLDPAEALGLAPLVVVRETPFNAESPLARQLGVITPVERFYVRSHFTQNDAADAAGWRLAVEGAVETPLALSLNELLALPWRTLVGTMECAGNGRRYVQPPVPGEPWDHGAVSTAEWTGVSLADVLGQANVANDAVEVLFAGADSGASPVDGATIAYQRSLPLRHARHPEVLIAFAMNGAPLTAEHGAPLRLIVPGWYGMASVKWLRSVQLIREPFEGAYQKARYVYDYDDGREPIPVSWMRVRSLIAQPSRGAQVPRGGVVVRGFAWSGAAPIESVEFSADDGHTWSPAELGDASSATAWRPWQFRWRPSKPGVHVLVSRGRDANGAQQPLDPEWNRHGYGNNSVQRIEVEVAE